MRFHSRWPAVVVLLLTACGGGDSPAPVQPTAVVSASPTTVSAGSSSTLTWSSTNATSCSAAGGWSGALATSGTRVTGALSASTSYSVTCTGAGGTSSPASATINIAPTAALTASPLTITAGSASALNWTSSNATACTASGGWSGALATSGTQSTGALTQATTYSMSCTGAGGASNTARVTVNVMPIPAPTVVLTANPTVVAAGSATVLTWSSSNASSCAAAGGWSGAKPQSGMQSTGALSTTTTYSMTCSGVGGTSKAASVTIVSGTVTVAPPIAALTRSQTQQFTASLPGGGAAAWSVAGVAGGNGTVGLIDSSGIYTAGTAAGTHTVVASSVAYPSLSGSAVAAVTDLAGVYTYHNDLARDGANTQEYALTTSNVNSLRFGKLFSCVVDGAIYGQPLWVANLPVNGASHNVVFVATEHDSLYAFDADANPCVPLWMVSLIDIVHGALAGETTVPSGVSGYLVGRGAGDLAPEVGVTGTPVIDPVSGTLYVVSKSVNSGQTTFYQRLHAIDVATGNEKPGSPTMIAATYPGGGDGGATVAFNPGTENQRGGLAWVNGVVYITWAAHEDVAPWYGWVMGYSYDSSAFSQVAVFNAAPDAQKAGIWMGAGAPASDSNGNIYLVTGNGTFDATSSSAPNSDFGDSLLQLTGSLGLSQYFTPSDQAADIAADLDFGAGGAAMLADLPVGSAVSHMLICGGKDGGLYVLNRDALGGFGDNTAVQRIDFRYPIYATGAYWNSNYYLSGTGGPLVQYMLGATLPQMSQTAASSHVYGFGGSTPSVSAAALQDGIVWTMDNAQNCLGTAPGCGPAVLYAHDAANISIELWNSGGSSTDAAGNAVKFTVPTVANGKVYVGTRGNNTGGVSGSTSAGGEMDVYGLRSH